MCHSFRQQLPVEGLFKSPLVKLPGSQRLSTADTFVLSQLDSLDDANASGGKNTGLRSRYVFTQQSRTFDLEWPLYLYCFYFDKYLINGVNLQLRLFLFRNEFVLMSAEASPSYKVTILDAVFKACKIKVDSAILITMPKRSLKRQSVTSTWNQTSKWLPFRTRQANYNGTMYGMENARPIARWTLPSSNRQVSLEVTRATFLTFNTLNSPKS